ncbi:MAG: linoleoyl-CoA desaturase [Marivirga sp.]|jgi:linoleoyl-CoA desaturase
MQAAEKLNNNNFFPVLKKRVDDYFKTNNINKWGNSKLYTKATILLVSFGVLYSAIVFVDMPIWLSITLCAVFGLNLAAIGFNVMHDGAHGSFSNNKHVNYMMGLTLNLMGGVVFIWKNKHNKNHHSFTNIEGMDDDIDIGPFMRVSTHQTKKWYHKYQHIYAYPLYATSYTFWIFFQDFKKYFTGKVANTPLAEMSFKEHLIFWVTKVAYVGTFFVLPIFMKGAIATFAGYLIVTAITGYTIGVVFQLAHVVEETDFHAVPVVGEKVIPTEWAIHQIRTTANFGTKSKVLNWYTGGLNFQVEHHLFPKISHVHYPAINKLVKETCEQFNVAYNEFPSMIAAMKSHTNHLKMIGIA